MEAITWDKRKACDKFQESDVTYTWTVEALEMPWIMSGLNFSFVKMKMILQNLTVAFEAHFTPNRC